MTQGIPSTYTFQGFNVTPIGSGYVETFGDVTGDLNDVVSVNLNGKAIVVAESYEVQQGIFLQPCHFRLTLGWGAVLQGLIAMAQPGTPFQLLIGNTPRFTGKIDGYEASVDANGGGTLTIHGRDNLAPIHDAYIEKETSFQDSTYADMVTDAVAETSGDYTIFFDNDANRKLTSGIGVTPLKDPADSAQQNPTGPTAKQLRTRIGERLFEFIMKQLRRDGLFLWAAADGSLVCSQPNGNQNPIYAIVRQSGQTRNAVNVTSVRYKNDTSGRYSSATIYARGGGKKFGRAKVNGGFDDTEMQGYGFNRPLVLRDAAVTNAEEAEYLARRKLAETRRAGWQLVYTVAGHTTPGLGTGQRVVWTPDTMVQVVDQELGLSDSYYVESVTFRRNPQTSTEITLQRASDLVFATGETESS